MFTNHILRCNYLLILFKHTVKVQFFSKHFFLFYSLIYRNYLIEHNIIVKHYFKF